MINEKRINEKDEIRQNAVKETLDELSNIFDQKVIPNNDPPIVTFIEKFLFQN